MAEYERQTTVKSHQMDIAPECSKCGGEMEDGFMLDCSHAARVVARWVAGKSEPSFWTGTKVRDKELHETQTFRCTKCRYLESYARAVI
jgi:hypothetical protein